MLAHTDKEGMTVGAAVSGSRPPCSKEKELESKVPTKAKEKEKECQFPGLLYQMLEIVDSLGLSHAISWSSNGQSFQVKDSALFMQLVAPRFFKATKYRSFQRQLNLWGFSRIERNSQGEGDDAEAGAGSWYHESFIRGDPERISEMKRTRIKNKRKRPPQLPDRRSQACSLHHVQELMRYSAEVVRMHNQEQIDDSRSDNNVTLIQSGSASDQAAFTVASSYEDALIDEIDICNCNIFSESEWVPPCPDLNIGQGIDCAPLLLEPLPATCAGILEGNRSSCELAEYGQLLDPLMQDSSW